MSRPWEFQLPTQIHFGSGMLRKLGALAAPLGTSALLVGYSDQRGLEEDYDRAVRAMKTAGMQVRTFFQVVPEPDWQLPIIGAAAACESGVQVVIGMGGGSVIDTAKAVALLVRIESDWVPYLTSGEPLPPACKALPVIAVPTTAGTGAEVSDVAVFTYAAKSGGEPASWKASLFGPAIRPAIALVDPELAIATPGPLTAACGADALGHAIEACLSRRANPLASMMAREAVGLIVAHLRRAVEHPQDPAPREPLALAAMLAGLAFSSAGVTAAHAMAQALGSVLGVPHGQAVAIATRLGLRYNAEPCQPQLCELALACGLAADTPQQQAAAFLRQIDELLRSVGLPDRVQAPAGAPGDLIGQLVRSAQASARIPILLNPRRLGEPQLAELFQQTLAE